jgi:hypothetical protein
MADTTAVILSAVVARLKAVSAVTNLVDQRIYSRVPQKTAFPYIQVAITSEPFAANDFSDMAHTVRLQCFGRDGTVVETINVRSAVFDALDRQEANMTLSSGNLVLFQYSGVSAQFVEDDGKTTQAAIEFTAIVN